MDIHQGNGPFHQIWTMILSNLPLHEQIIVKVKVLKSCVVNMNAALMIKLF